MRKKNKTQADRKFTAEEFNLGSTDVFYGLMAEMMWKDFKRKVLVWMPAFLMREDFRARILMEKLQATEIEFIPNAPERRYLLGNLIKIHNKTRNPLLGKRILRELVLTSEVKIPADPVLINVLRCA
jgi:hypothetical protein